MSSEISLDSLIQQDDGQGLRGDAAQNRERLLETAVSLFDQHGVANVTMADIAKTAGVGKGTLYRKFSNKSELCLALLDSQMRTFQNSMLNRMQQMAANGQSPLEQLDQFLDSLVNYTADHLPLLCAISNGAADSPQFNRPHFWMNMTVRGLLEQARQQGLVNADLDVQFTADALVATLGAPFLQAQLNAGFSRDRISKGLCALVSALHI